MVYIESVFHPEIADQALQCFGISDPTFGDPIFGSNAVVKVTSPEGSFALRLHRPSRLSTKIERELNFVDKLQATGTVRVPRPIRSITGQYCCSLVHDGDDVRCSLLSWIEGESRTPGRGFGIETARKAGIALGEVHHYSQSLPPIAPETDDLRLSRRVLEGDAVILSRLPELASPINELKRRMLEILDIYPAVGLIHGDFILKNLLCHPCGLGVLDFDDSIVEHYVLDFAGMLENLSQVPNERALRRVFLEGYASTGHDVRHVDQYQQTLIALRHHAGIAWAIGMVAEQRISEDYFRRVTQHRASEIMRLMAHDPA